jgi:hypothetical protein
MSRAASVPPRLRMYRFLRVRGGARAAYRPAMPKLHRLTLLALACLLPLAAVPGAARAAPQSMAPSGPPLVELTAPPSAAQQAFGPLVSHPGCAPAAPDSSFARAGQPPLAEAGAWSGPSACNAAAEVFAPSAIPEPSTVAMMIVGLGVLLGGVHSKRRGRGSATTTDDPSNPASRA